jgi:hypothetical protein
MPGISDFVLGGIVPLIVAIAASAIGWRLARRAGAAWSAGVVVGFAAGAFALEARDSGAAEAARRLVRAIDAHEWLPLVAAVGAVPALAAALAGRRWVEWPLAAALCVASPLWLLGGKYRASQQLREAGFADDAITPAQAALVVAGIAAATLAAWALWRRAADAAIGLPRVRAGLAIATAVGAALAAAMAGGLAVGQAFGALAAAMGGCAVVGLAVGDGAGPEAARGPVLLAFSGLLAASVAYIPSFLPWYAAALAAALVLPVGWLPGEARRRLFARRLVRGLLCLAPLSAAAGHAAKSFLASEQHSAEEAGERDPFYDMYATPPAGTGASTPAP